MSAHRSRFARHAIQKECTRARRGELADFTGVSSPYEAPLAADLILDMGQLSLPEAVGQLVGRIGRHAPADE